MIARLFFVALFSVALATKQAGDFLHGNALVQEKFTDEETLRRLTEEAAEKARQLLTRANNVKVEFTNQAKDTFDALMWQATECKAQLQKMIKDTVFKGVDKNKGAEVYECITKKGQKGLELLDLVKGNIPISIHFVTEKHMHMVMHYKYIVKEFNEYVEAFYLTKSQELKKANSDAIRKKIMSEVIDKMKLLESILENINRNITNTKSVFFENLGLFVYFQSNTVRTVLYEEGIKIKQCVP